MHILYKIAKRETDFLKMKNNNYGFFILFLCGAAFVIFTLFFLLESITFLNADLSFNNDWWSSYSGGKEFPEDKKKEFYLMVLNNFIWMPIQILVSIFVAFFTYKNIRILNLDSRNRISEKMLNDLDSYLVSDHSFKYSGKFAHELSRLLEDSPKLRPPLVTVL